VPAHRSGESPGGTPNCHAGHFTFIILEAFAFRLAWIGCGETA
jgi:hypothetical protein